MRVVKNIVVVEDNAENIARYFSEHFVSIIVSCHKIVLLKVPKAHALYIRTLMLDSRFC